jgi:hypothetical protein
VTSLAVGTDAVTSSLGYAVRLDFFANSSAVISLIFKSNAGVSDD